MCKISNLLIYSLLYVSDRQTKRFTLQKIPKSKNGLQYQSLIFVFFLPSSLLKKHLIHSAARPAWLFISGNISRAEIHVDILQFFFTVNEILIHLHNSRAAPVTGRGDVSERFRHKLFAFFPCRVLDYNCASRSREAANFPMRLCASFYTGICISSVSCYLMKCVHTCSSVSGRPNCSLPSAMHFIRNVMFLASTRIVCFPSPSMSACPGSLP